MKVEAEGRSRSNHSRGRRWHGDSGRFLRHGLRGDMHKFRGIKFIIFDLDGTLIDGYRAIHDSLNTALGQMGKEPVSLTKVKRLVGTGLENLLREFVSEEELPEAVRIFRARFKEVCLTGSFLLGGVEPVLKKLKGAGIRLGIASNKPGERVRDICRHLKIDGYFEAMLGAMDVKELKPHPEMMQETMRRMGARSEETLYVGDMHLDVQTARAAEVRVACVLTGSSTREQLTEAEPDAIIETLEELTGLVGVGSTKSK